MPTPEVIAQRVGMVERVAREVFGYAGGPRPAQRTILGHVMRGEDVFAVAPTGLGKSFTYQAPAMILPGLTVVVSPLVALMRDQHAKCAAWGIAAGRLTGDMNGDDQARTVRMLPELNLLYVAPERLQNRRFLDALSGCRVRLIVIDEAHTASRWGASFRSGFSHIGVPRRMFPKAYLLAVTATADDEIEADVVRLTGMRPGYARVVLPPDRPNLTYHGVEDTKEAHLISTMRRHLQGPGSAIVYTSSRAEAERLVTEIGGAFEGEGAAYHAGMDHALRSAVQDRFVSGGLRWVAATSAFGMGIDRADIRLVYNWQHPPTMADYAQMAGRAGRDGLPSECWLRISGRGRNTVDFMNRNQNPELWVYERLWGFLTERGRLPAGTRVRTTQQRLHGLFPRMAEALLSKVDAAMAYLEFRGHVETMPGPSIYRLPVRNLARVREYARRYRSVRPSGAVVTVTADPDGDDPVQEMVAEGCVLWNDPEESMLVRTLRADLAVTEAEIQARVDRADAQHAAVCRMAGAKDPAGYLRSFFLKATHTEGTA